MTNVIAFLETMGQDAELRHAGRAELYNELTERQVDAGAQWAILRGDGERLASLLAAPAIVCCGMEPAEEEEPKRDDDEVQSGCDIRAVAA